MSFKTLAKHWYGIALVLICLTTIWLYWPVFGQFFSADDWFHLRLIQISEASQFVQFFNFQANPYQASFYRPLPTQVFFWLMYQLFGLQAQYWYAASLATALITYLVLFKLIESLTESKISAVISVLIVGLSHTQFTRIFFLSGFQETSLILFSCLFLLWSWHATKAKQYLWAWFSLLAALMSKETAVILPAILAIILFKKALDHKKLQLSLTTIWSSPKLKFWLLSAATVILYLLLRYFVQGVDTSQASQYHYNFSPRLFIKTIQWYSLWSLGAFEGLINYLVGSTVLPKFSQDFPFWSSWHNLALLLSITSFLALVTRWIWSLSTKLLSVFQSAFYKDGTNSFKITTSLLKDHYWIVTGALWFWLSLAPVLFLPEHKYALTMGLAMVGAALAIGQLVVRFPKLGVIFLTFWLSINFISIQMNLNTHYSILRSDISLKVYTFLERELPQLETGSHSLYFYNDLENIPSNWGVSKQIREALSGDEFFQVVYPQAQIKVWYQDDNPELVPSNTLAIPSGQFLLH